MSNDAAKLTDVLFPGTQILGSAVSSLAPKPPAPPTPPMAPGDPANAEARAARDAAAEEARKRSNSGRASTNPTGGLGDTSTPNLAAKSLLGG
jgi:hypothetical protein